MMLDDAWINSDRQITSPSSVCGTSRTVSSSNSTTPKEKTCDTCGWWSPCQAQVGGVPGVPYDHPSHSIQWESSVQIVWIGDAFPWFSQALTIDQEFGAWRQLFSLRYPWETPDPSSWPPEMMQCDTVIPLFIYSTIGCAKQFRQYVLY